MLLGIHIRHFMIKLKMLQMRSYAACFMISSCASYMQWSTWGRLLPRGASFKCHVIRNCVQTSHVTWDSLLTCHVMCWSQCYHWGLSCTQLTYQTHMTMFSCWLCEIILLMLSISGFKLPVDVTLLLDCSFSQDSARSCSCVKVSVKILISICTLCAGMWYQLEWCCGTWCGEGCTAHNEGGWPGEQEGCARSDWPVYVSGQLLVKIRQGLVPSMCRDTWWMDVSVGPVFLVYSMWRLSMVRYLWWIKVVGGRKRLTFMMRMVNSTWRFNMVKYLWCVEVNDLRMWGQSDLDVRMVNSMWTLEMVKYLWCVKAHDGWMCQFEG